MVKKLTKMAKSEIRYALEELNDLNDELGWELSRTDISNIKKYLKGLLDGTINDSRNITWWNENDAEGEFEFFTKISEDGYFNPEEWLTEEQIEKLGIKKVKRRRRRKEEDDVC